MDVLWLAPMAAWGALAVAVPILVHLLTRQERKPLPFPSLRFLTASSLVSVERRRLEDWLLLAVRAGIVTCAVAALAGPLFVMPARQRAWAARTARAIVVADAPAAAAAIDEERRTAFASAVIPLRERMADALRAAGEWLREQPPAGREVVVVGDLRDGSVDAADVQALPAEVGLRFVPLPGAASTGEWATPVLRLRAGAVGAAERRGRFADAGTEIAAGDAPASGPAPQHRLEVRAGADDRALAEAALRAVLDEGVIADATGARHVVVVWPGAMDGVAGAAPAGPLDAPAPWMVRTLAGAGMGGANRGGTLEVRLPARPDGAQAVRWLHAIAGAAFDDPAVPREPRAVAAADLARWSRPPGGVPADAPPRDEGDRRVLWGAALALLAVESLLRARRRGTEREEEVARVA